MHVHMYIVYMCITSCDIIYLIRHATKSARSSTTGSLNPFRFCMIYICWLLYMFVHVYWYVGCEIPYKTICFKTFRRAKRTGTFLTLLCKSPYKTWCFIHSGARSAPEIFWAFCMKTLINPYVFWHSGARSAPGKSTIPALGDTGQDPVHRGCTAVAPRFWALSQGLPQALWGESISLSGRIYLTTNERIIIWR